MKIATGNRINEFWQELKGVLVPKEKVLKTIEEIEANTNEENIAGATALKAVNNKLTSGLGGNNLIYNESEDAYYIQHGADSVPKKLGSIPLDAFTQLYGTNAGWLQQLSYTYTITKTYKLIFVIVAGSGNMSGMAHAAISTTASSKRQLINTTVGSNQDGTNLALSSLMIEDAKAGNTITMSAGACASAWIFAVE